MTITIGRASIAEDPDTLRHSGDRLIIGGDIDATSSDQMKAIRQQMLGMIDNDDEDVFPLTWDQDSSHDGFYEVASVAIDPYSTHLTTGLLRYEVELERIPNYANPRFESVSSAVVRPNGHSITSADCNAGTVLYGPTSNYDWSAPNLGFPLVTRGGASSSDQVGYFVETAPFTNARVSWRAEPSAHYSYACVLEQLRDGVWYPVVGRDASLVAGANWRVSNGLLQVGPNASTPSSVDVSIRQFSPAQWETTRFLFGSFAGSWATGSFFSVLPLSSSAALSSPVIMRNGPDRVVLRFDGQEGGTQVLSLSAGDHHCVIRHTSAGNAQWGAALATPATTVDMPTATVGVRLSADDANGNRPVIMGSASMLRDNVNGRAYRSVSANNVTIGLGVIYNGGSAVSGNQAADLTAQFMGAPSIRRRVTAR